MRQEGKASKLTDQRVAELQAIGFVWYASSQSEASDAADAVQSAPPPEDSWTLRLIELKAFKAEFGHCSVPKVYEPNRPLGRVRQIRGRTTSPFTMILLILF